MKFYEKYINGKQYSYAQSDIHIAKGKRIRRYASLGPVESQSKSDRLKKFIEKLKGEESAMRSQYWSDRCKDSKFTKYSSIKKIEDRRSKLVWNTEKIGDLAASLVRDEYQIEFIVNSNQIEGSKVPRKIAEDQILHPAKSIDAESKNATKAIHFVETNFQFGPLLHVNELQEILLAHDPKNIGFRTESRIVADVDVLEWQDIKKELRHLLDRYKAQKWKTYPPKLAFDFYYAFERIHPFWDGNGRTGRLLMNRILQDSGYPPIIIWNQNRARHLNVFKKRMDGRPEYFYRFMTQQMMKSYNFFQKKLSEVKVVK